MVIGVDIDDTFVKTNKRALQIIKRENITENVDYYEQLSDLSGFIHSYFKEIVHTAELFEGAKEVLQLLRNAGNKIIFITSRAYQSGADTEEDTIEYLRQKGVEYDAIYLRTPDKLDICLKEHIDIFIDDKEKTLKPLNDAGIRCIKMTSHENSKSEFETVSNWYEILKLILSKNNNIKL